jgi:hypothetical protein
MRTVQRSFLALGLAALATVPCAATAAAAQSTAPGPDLRVAPAAPTRATPLTVSWRAPAAGTYGVTVTVRPASATRLACAYGASATSRRALSGRRLVTTLRPTSDPSGTRQWCTGPATVTVRRFPANSGAPQIVAARRVTIRRAPGEFAPGPRNTPAALRLLAGSTVTISAAGHADRTSPVNGVLSGSIPSPFRLNDDISIRGATGGLVPVDLGADPLCAGAVAPRTLQVTPASAVTLRASGRVTFDVVLAGTPAQLGGCAPGPPTGTTTLQLTGQTGARGLLALNLDGTAQGITLNLLVLVDLSGRP